MVEARVARRRPGRCSGRAEEALPARGSRRQRGPLGCSGNARRSPEDSGLRAARLPGRPLAHRPRPRAAPPGLLRRRAHGDRGGLSAVRCVHARRVPALEERARRNAPSRWRLRPASRLTAAEAAADRRAINLGCSVLGAVGTLRGRPDSVKGRSEEVVAICDLFFSHRLELRMQLHALDGIGEKNGRPRGLDPEPQTRRRLQRA